MEDYKKRYEEALERARKLGTREMPIDPTHSIQEQIFPELNESEDEKIMKGLIEHLKELKEQSVEGSYLKRPEHYDAWIAWVEKHKKYEPVFAELCESEDEKIMKDLKFYLEVRRCHTNDDEEYISCNKFLSWLEKQKESQVKVVIPKFRVGDLVRSKKNPDLTYKVIEVGIVNSLGNLDYKVEIRTHGVNTELFIEISKMDSWGELVEQKPTDKVEPKFKVGDWIVYNRNDSSREILYVYDIRDGRYYFNDNVHFSWSIKECDEKSNHWTIHDAKDGDVLVCSWQHNGKNIEQAGIFKEYIGRHGGCSKSFKIYAGIDWDKHLLIDDTMGSSEICPATKEQRDLLFQKMKEEGYEWDVEKKELKKIKQKPVEWSKKDEKTIEEMIKHGNLKPSEVIWLKSIKPQPKKEWSEEDEKMLKLCDEALFTKTSSTGLGTIRTPYDDARDWLKSIRPNHWKPSEEQMLSLQYAISNTTVQGYEDELISLYSKLKDL